MGIFVSKEFNVRDSQEIDCYWCLSRISGVLVNLEYTETKPLAVSRHFEIATCEDCAVSLKDQLDCAVS